MTDKELLRIITQKIAWINIALLGYLGYYVQVRPFFENHYGIWSMGFLDGAIVTSTVFLFAFYVWSFLSSMQK